MRSIGEDKIAWLWAEKYGCLLVMSDECLSTRILWKTGRREFFMSIVGVEWGRESVWAELMGKLDILLGDT